MKEISFAESLPVILCVFPIPRTIDIDNLSLALNRFLLCMTGFFFCALLQDQVFMLVGETKWKRKDVTTTILCQLNYVYDAIYKIRYTWYGLHP